MGTRLVIETSGDEVNMHLALTSIEAMRCGLSILTKKSPLSTNKRSCYNSSEVIDVKIDLDEHTTNLIREHMHLTIIVEMCRKELESLKESRVFMKDFNIRIYKMWGRFYSDQLKKVKNELRKLSIATWIEDQGDIVYVHVTKRGVKERFGVKRRIINEEIEKMFTKMEKYLDKYEGPEYKPEPFRPPGEFVPK